MKKSSLILLLLATAGCLQAQQTAAIQSLDSAYTQLYKTNRFNGAVLYAEKGKVVFKKAWGITAANSGTALSTASAFNLASVSKQFVCMAIMQLKEKGLLQYDDDCKKYIPELPYDSISIRHLMTHTSGIPEYFDLFVRHKTPLDTLTNEKMIEQFATLKPALDFATGTKWAYCNTNYVLLVSIIERITQQPFATYFHNNIAKPLGLKNTYVYHILMPAVPTNHVYGFTETGEQKKLNDLTPFDGVVGDGNIYSSVEDLYLWEQSLYTQKLVKQSTLQEAFTAVTLKDGTTYPYGFGWGVDEKKAGVFEHTGGWVGFANIIYRDTVNHRTIIELSSGSNGWGIRTARNFMQGKPLDITQTVLIKNVQLVDGTGTAARAGAVRLQGKRILATGNLTMLQGETVIDGEGKILAPGFIDSHSHLLGSLADHPEALAALNQGITTIVAGQDGDSDPADSIKAQLQRIPAAINVATYTGHSSIREKVMGEKNLSRPATATELEKIKALLKDDLQKGSLGLSSGLEYEAAFYSNRHEVIELAKVAAAEHTRYISHIRSEDVTMEDAVDEIIQIGREAKLPVQISHIKIALKDDWGTAPRLLATLQQARAEGIDITADCYPYDFWNSTIRVLFPKKDFTSLEAARYATNHLFDADKSVMVRFAPDTAYKGKTVSNIASMRKQSPEQTLLYLVAAAEQYRQQHPDAGGVETIMGKSMSENDLVDFLKWPHANICSDGANGGHPRGYGSYTRILHRYVATQKNLSWENAIHKMTALAAEHTGIKNRGIIAPGYFADLVLIDPATVKDNASIQNPKALSDGILKVWVNGVLVYKDKTAQQNFPGEFVGR
jgi:N-acyl-D-amino-acid deacylase